MPTWTNPKPEGRNERLGVGSGYWQPRLKPRVQVLALDAGLVALPEGFAEFALQDFSGATFGQGFGSEEEAVGDFEFCQARGEMRP